LEERQKKFKSIEGLNSKCYALFIDEINRANISAVFGELITLIEDNKRMGQKDEIWLKLPISGEDFCIPPNLFIIGTMNTADKSIALLDIALRRRFEFIGMYPLYQLDNDSNPWWSGYLKRLNQAIYDHKGKNPDFFIGHALFIDKGEKELSNIYNSKILPLLMEYFQNNSEKVEKVLISAEVTVRRGTILDNFQLFV